MVVRSSHSNVLTLCTIVVPDPVGGHSFDLSEFPVLGARSRPDSSSLSSAMGIPGILPSRHGYGTGMLSYIMPTISSDCVYQRRNLFSTV